MTTSAAHTIVVASIAFWADGTLYLTGDHGKPEAVKFKARFRRLKTSERKALDKRLDEGRALSQKWAKGEITEEQHAAGQFLDQQFLDEVLLEWDLTDKRGERVPYTRDAHRTMVEEWDGFEAALVTAYFDANRSASQAAAIAKNSVEPSAAT